ncbi:hypothetical protein ISR92_00920 [Patescibacteria group bacterium]|nr:hypothetical protein [Patescibacteria group bacterium]
MSKKIISVMTILAFLLSLMPQSYVIAQTVDQCEQVLVSGQVQESSWEEEAGSTPANSFYFMDKLGDWLKLRLFSFTKDARINTLLDQAQERIGELERLQRQNNLKPNYVNRIVGSYNDIMMEVSERLTDLQAGGSDMTDIMSRLAVLSAKNKTIIAGIMTKISAQNYDAIQSAYNQSGGNFCEVVDSWVARENQCNDTILLIQESSDSFNKIAEEIANVETTSVSINNSYQQVDSYLDIVNSINTGIESSKNSFDSSLKATDLSFNEKESVLKGELDDFRGDYFYLLNNQPSVDTAIRDIIAYSTQSIGGLVARARAGTALIDVALNNSEISADIGYIEKIMSANLSDEKSLDNLLEDLKDAKRISIETEVNTLSSLVNKQVDEINKLEEGRNICEGLRSDFSDILDRLDTGRLSQAKNGILAMYNDMSVLDSIYLPNCGMLPVVQTLYDILVTGNALDPNNSCSSQSYIDNYINEIVAWGEDRMDLWDTMIDQHDGLVNQLTNQLGSYEMISTNKNNTRDSLDSYFNNYKSIDTSSIASAELNRIQLEIADLDIRLIEAEKAVTETEEYKNVLNANLQEANNSVSTTQTIVNQAENEFKTAQEEVNNASFLVEKTRNEYQEAEANTGDTNALKNSAETDLKAAQQELEVLSKERDELKVEIESMKVSLNSFSITAVRENDFQLEEEILLDLTEDFFFDRAIVESKEVELETIETNIITKEAQVSDLQTKYNSALQAFNNASQDYASKESSYLQANSNYNTAVQTLTQKGDLYEAKSIILFELEAELSQKQSSYNTALTDYNETVIVKDVLEGDLSNQNNLYDNAIAKAIKLEIINEELNLFVEQKFNNTVSNYETSVNNLSQLNDEWVGVASEYSNISNDVVSLRNKMNGNNLTQIRSGISSLKSATYGLENSVEYNMPAYQISHQVDTLDRLMNMRILGQGRIDNIKASVQTSVVNLQAITCTDAQSIYDQGVTDVCNNFDTGNYINTCQVINNLETQIVDTCKAESSNNCGNSIVNDGEQCDDGNKLSGDGCSALCQSEITAYCGDGRIQSPNSFGVNEECENIPANSIDGDGCNSQCLNEAEAYCGDGILQQPNDKNFSEQCDDGNKFVGDGCNNLCQIERGAQKSIKIRKTIP